MNPKYDLGDCVIQKHYGTGMIDQRRITDEATLYHVRFDTGNCGWIPERDLILVPRHRKEPAQ